MSVTYYTVAEVADRYRVRPRTVRCWIKRGELVALKPGRLLRISDRALSDFEKKR